MQAALQKLQSATTVELEPLREWETRGPQGDNAQMGLFLQDESSRAQARALTQSQRLGVRELREGLEFTTYSYVGRVCLGGVAVSILPKISAKPLVTLLRFAYGLRNLSVISDAEQYMAVGGLQDVLCAQLAQEAEELLKRGLARHYRPRSESLARPRGRLDIVSMARQGPLVEPALPCTYHPRTADHLLNRVLLAGLNLASKICGDLKVRTKLRRLAAILDDDVSGLVLNLDVINRAQRHLNRTNQAAKPAITLTWLLLKSLGISLEAQSERLLISGFLFDMNHFFQALISRLLHEYLRLETVAVKDEKTLQGMIRWGTKAIPGKRLGAPRPDYVITKNGKIVALLDAKYRDIWKKGLPSNWLYQVSVYALAGQDKERYASASIIYPTDASNAAPAEIEVLHPLRQTRLCTLWLRPVNLAELADLLNDQSKQAKKHLAAITTALITGIK